MRTPIAHALAWPERIESGVSALDLLRVGRLDFQAPDDRRFPCLRLARTAAEVGGTAPAMLNAANEVAVDAFLNRRIRFTEIASIIDDVLNHEASVPTFASKMCWRPTGVRDFAGRWLYRNGR